MLVSMEVIQLGHSTTAFKSLPCLANMNHNGPVCEISYDEML